MLTVYHHADLIHDIHADVYNVPMGAVSYCYIVAVQSGKEWLYRGAFDRLSDAKHEAEIIGGFVFNLMYGYFD